MADARRSFPFLRDRAPFLWLLALLALTAALYARALGYWFAVEDDRLYVTHNPLLTSWHLRHLWTMWQAEISLNFAPVTLLSYSLDYRWWGMDPFGYHLTNLLWHLLNGVFVYVFLRTMDLGRWGSWGGALWFLLHPAQVESVVWIAERKNLLATAGTLVSVWAYLSTLSDTRVPRRQMGWRVLWFLAGVGAMLAKASAVMIPVLCVLLARFRLPYYDSTRGGQGQHRRAWRAALRETWPLWACALLVGLMHLHTQRGELGLAGWHSGSWNGTLGVLVRVWARYLQLLVRPGLLSMYHPIDPALPSWGWQDPQVWHGAGVLLVVAAVLWWWARRRPQVGVWVGWYALTLAPMASLVFIGVHDRYLYLPMVGVAGLAGFLVEEIWTHTKRWPQRRWWLAAGLAGVMVWLAWGVCRRVAVWRDPQALYADAIRHAPALDTPRIILAEVAWKAGHHAEAEALYRSMAEMAPAHWNGWLMRGWARARLGDAAGADAAIAQARAAAPQQPMVDRFAGRLAAAQHRWAEAFAAYGRVVERQPDADLYAGLATAADALHQPAAAARWYHRALAMEPWCVRARRALARCLQAAGDGDPAAESALADYWERAWSDLRDAHLQMSTAYHRRGMPEEAARSADEAEAITSAATAEEAARLP